MSASRLVMPTLFVLAAIVPSAGAEEPTIESRLTRDTVQVAEPFQFTLEVQSEVGAVVTFPSVNERLGDFDVIDHHDRFDIPIDSKGTRRSWGRTWTLESIDTGELIVPALDIFVTRQQPSGTRERTTLTSQPVTVRVRSVLESRADPAKIRDLQPLIDVPMPSSESRWVLWSVGGISLAALTFLMITKVRRGNQLTPRAWVLDELGQLKQQFENPALETKPALDELSMTLRQYLEWEHNIPAMTLTADEVARELSSQSASESLATLHETLAIAEQVKYAGLPIEAFELINKIDQCQRAILAVGE